MGGIQILTFIIISLSIYPIIMYCLGQFVFVCYLENYIVYKHHNCHCTLCHGIQCVQSFIPVAHSVLDLRWLMLNCEN